MNADDDTSWRLIGAAIRVRLEPPDIFHSSGELGADGRDLHALFAEVKRLAVERGRLFWLADATGLRTLPAAWRSLIANELAHLPLHGFVAYSPSFHHRVLATLITKAMRVLYPGSPRPRIYDTEAEARAWIERRRRELGLPGPA